MNRRILLGATALSLTYAAAGCAPKADTSGDFNAFLDRVATQFLHESPEYATSLAVTTERAGGPFMDRLSDASKDGFRRVRGIAQAAITEMEGMDKSKLTGQDAVSYDVVQTSLANNVATAQFEFGAGAGAPYVVTQLTGSYTSIPDFLDSQHPLTNREQADAYLARLQAYARVLDQETQIIGEDAGNGVIPPDFAIAKGLEQLRGFAQKAPKDTVLVQSIRRRLAEVEEIAAADKTTLGDHAETIVRDEVLPAYNRQIAALAALQPRATHDAGIWKLPQGAEMYAASLRSQTTTDMSPDDIHQMGLDLVATMNAEMDTILKAQGLTRGTVAERVQALSHRPEQLYANTDAGREQLLEDLNGQVQRIRAMMPQVCGTLARADLEIKRVPPFTEAGAPGGYYNSAALDGSRPGAYYINLRPSLDANGRPKPFLEEWPKFSLPTLSYHEGIPGHHWQISIAQEAQALPFIRSALLGFNAYQEGWGLYAEQLADEMGVYQNDQVGRLGFLQSAAFRASRLVVDTGIHSKRWTREQAIESMLAATGDQRSSITTEIERYCVWPGQACGYMVGRQAIVKMREDAKTAMGDRFDLKGFHDTVLTNGALPLSVAAQLVRQWSAATQPA